MYTRQNAWQHGGTFDNPDLLAYAIAVGQMMERPLNDRLSWWFFAAIHGQYVSEQGFPGWGSVPAPSKIPTTPLPPQADQDKFWDQCQHQSWYFAPWHRGYLIALEAQLRAEIVELGGPGTWALPYWNYFGPDGQFKMPPAFAQPTLPSTLPAWVPKRYVGASNPLYVTARYGPDANGDIYIPTTAGTAQHSGNPDFAPDLVTKNCLRNTVYTGSNANTPFPGFGGPNTGFHHGSGSSGNLEQNPHNLVHVYVGGQLSDSLSGLMSDPGLAALDPIFYLHHANIDRLWAVWNQTFHNANPMDSDWLDGPARMGQRDFAMPMPDGSVWVYTPRQVASLSLLNYTYEDLSALSLVHTIGPRMIALRLRRLGAVDAAALVEQGANVVMGTHRELLGSSSSPIPLSGKVAVTNLRLDPGVRTRVSSSLSSASETHLPDRVYLDLHNVRGTTDAHVLSVYINLPEGDPRKHPELLAGSVGLFGLRRSSQADGAHGGEGLNFVLDITDIVDTLHLSSKLNADLLHVTIIPNREVSPQSKITIGRISLYRQGS